MAHGLDGDKDTCLHVTCRQQGHVHGIMVWTEMRTPVCMSPTGSKDMCMVSWSGRDEDTCLHVTYRQQGNVHDLWHRVIAGKLKFLSPVHYQEECMASWSKEDNDVSCVLTVERVYEIWGGEG